MEVRIRVESRDELKARQMRDKSDTKSKMKRGETIALVLCMREAELRNNTSGETALHAPRKKRRLSAMQPLT